MRRITWFVVVALLLAIAAGVVAAPAKPAPAKAAPAKPSPKAAPTPAKPAPAKTVDRAKLLAQFKTAPNSAVVAVVNGQKITKGDLMADLWDWQAPSVLDEMIQQTLIKQAAQKKGVSLTEKDINARVEETKKRMPPDQSFDEVLARYGITKANFLARTKSGLLAERIVEKDINPTDADYAQFIKASHVLVRIQPGKDEDERKKNEDAAKEKIDKIAAEIKGGLDFAEAAKKYSEDEQNKDKGGDLGWFKRGRMAPEFEKAAFDLKPGDVSEPVKTFYGYHLIKVTKLGKDATAEEKAELRDQIVREQKGMKMPQWYQNLRSSAKIENYLNPEPPKPPAPKPAPPPKPAPKAEEKKPEAKPAEAKPAETKPAESKPAEEKPAANP